LSQVFDELVQGHPAALPERCSLGLAVIGQDHDLVPAPGGLDYVGKEPDETVEALQRPHGLNAARPGVVGHFVVVGPIDIDDRRRPRDLIGHERHTEVAQQGCRNGALEREN
jgi:hypothetical protein